MRLNDDAGYGTHEAKVYFAEREDLREWHADQDLVRVNADNQPICDHGVVIDEDSGHALGCGACRDEWETRFIT